MSTANRFWISPTAGIAGGLQHPVMSSPCGGAGDSRAPLTISAHLEPITARAHDTSGGTHQ